MWIADKRRHPEQAKDADRLELKGTRAGVIALNSMPADVAPPANRQDLIHSGNHTEQGKPLPLLTQESKPQGKPIEVRVKDDRESEGHLVMR